MDAKFIIQRNNKDFVLYIGLVDEAHKRGLRSIKTTLLQIPNESNKFTAICSACVTLEQDGIVKEFWGIGDADKSNVGANIAPHSIRMAETRSKARALRDAVNVSMVCVEELGDEGAPQQSTGDSARPHTQQGSRAQFRPGQQPARAPAAGTIPPGAPPVNDTGVQCPACHAPAGNRHGKMCAACR